MKLNYQIILQELGETIVAIIKDNETQQVVHAYKMNETGAFIINQIKVFLDYAQIGVFNQILLEVVVCYFKQPHILEFPDLAWIKNCLKRLGYGQIPMITVEQVIVLIIVILI